MCPQAEMMIERCFPIKYVIYNGMNWSFGFLQMKQNPLLALGTLPERLALFSEQNRGLSVFANVTAYNNYNKL